MEKKITKVQALTFVLDNCTLPDDVKDKIKGMINTLSKKSATKRPSKNQAENEVLKEIVLAVVTDEGATVSEIQTRDERISPVNGISNQRVSALLRALVADNKVVKESAGKKSLFRLA